MRIKRDAFLYLEGKDDKFAQCGTCRLREAPGECSILKSPYISEKDGSCGVYIEGPPCGEGLAGLSRNQVGYVERQVRCENCKFFSAGECMLFHKLNGIFPELFDLNEKVDRYGCCNAQVPG